MKYRCDCGHIVADQTDNLPWKAHLVPDQDAYQLLDDIEEQARNFAAASQDPTLLAKWREGFFSADYPPDDSPSEFFGYVLMALWGKYTRFAYQCEECGALSLDDADGKPTEFRLASPEGNRRVLAGSQTRGSRT